MNRSSFLAFALDCGLSIARQLAIANGITPAQADLWASSLKSYRANYHYSDQRLVAARSIH